MSRIFGERCSSQASATWCGEAPSRAATSLQLAGLQRGETAERVERDKGDAQLRAAVEQRIVAAVSQVVPVLHADDPADGLRLGHLIGRHVAETQVPDQALALQPGQHAERPGDRAGGRPRRGGADPEI